MAETLRHAASYARRNIKAAKKQLAKASAHFGDIDGYFEFECEDRIRGLEALLADLDEAINEPAP